MTCIKSPLLPLSHSYMTKFPPILLYLPIGVSGPTSNIMFLWTPKALTLNRTLGHSAIFAAHRSVTERVTGRLTDKPHYGNISCNSSHLKHSMRPRNQTSKLIMLTVYMSLQHHTESENYQHEQDWEPTVGGRTQCARYSRGSILLCELPGGLQCHPHGTNTQHIDTTIIHSVTS